MKTFLVSVMLILFCAVAAQSATLTVNPGQSIQDAINRANAGDTVSVEPGTYHERLTVKSDLILKSRVKRQAILDGSSLGNGTMIVGEAVSNVTIQDFHITKHTGGGIQFGGGCHNIFMVGNEISWQKHESGQGHAIVVYGMKWVNRIWPLPTTNIVADGNYIHDVITGVRAAFNETLTFSWNIENFKITNNVLENTSMIGIDLIGKDIHDGWIDPTQQNIPGNIANPRKGIISGNRLINVGTHSMDVAIYLDGATDVLIENNYMERSNGHGIVTSVEEEVFVTKRVIVRNNVGVNGVRHLTPTATNQHSMSRHIRASHNTMVVTGANASPDGGRLLSFYSGEDIKVFNNVFSVVPSSENVLMENYNDWAFKHTPILDGNCWNPASGGWLQYKGVFYSNVADYIRGSGQDASGIAGDPQFVDMNGRDFHLKDGSPCRDSGVPLTVTSSSGSGTTVPLDDVYWFTDGWGYIAGTDIQIGDEVAKVIEIDYNSSTVTLDRSVAWSAGASTSYPHVGGIDRGAFEHGLSDIPPPSTASLKAPVSMRTF